MKKYAFLFIALVSAFLLCGCAVEDNDLTSEFQSSGEQSQENSQSQQYRSSSQQESTSAREAAPRINSSTVIDEENLTADTGMITFGEEGGNTPTGFAPLAKVTYPVTEAPDGISDKKLSHSHGPASGGKAHFTVEEFQDTFDKYDALTLDRKSEGKVLYLTFDCGYEYENLTARVLDVLKEKQVKATFFCTLDHIEKERELIARMIKEGHIVGNHSSTHPSFADISREQMIKEIEETENYLRENFGYAAKYFRFPAGEYTENALDAVKSMGYMSVFWSVAYDDWNTDNVRGRAYATEKVISRLHPGAVILLHSVSKDNADALGEIIDKARSEGYVFRSLEEYNG
ncbi:MAG: polysaccharide deacetylase family protein [Clostridia bacterium]|nr:polysaccharide deacetylase family protein [Clostridia bacterium]